MRPLQPSRAALCMAILISGSANLILAASSLYWKALEEIPPLTVLTYRIILSTAALSFFIFTPRKVNQIKNLTPRSILIHCAASLLVAVNWLTFISASINGNVLESGLGYLLAPFIAIVLGISIYRERITHTKILAISISFIAIVLLIAFSNTLNHWIYLLIATTWGSYTYLKKATPVDAVNGLFLETTFLTAGLALVIWLFDLPIILPGELSDRSSGLIWLAGLISIIPLLMFSFATGKMPLALTGLIQFTLPIALLTIGVLFNEQKISTLSLTLIFMTAGMLIAVLAYDMKIAATSNLAQSPIDSEGVHPAQQHNPCAAKRPQSRADGAHHKE